MFVCKRHMSHTVDGRNPAPHGMHKTWTMYVNRLIFTISTGAGFLPSTVNRIICLSSIIS